MSEKTRRERSRDKHEKYQKTTLISAIGGKRRKLKASSEKKESILNVSTCIVSLDHIKALFGSFRDELSWR